MKLYTAAHAPNPRIAEMLLLEKQIEAERVPIDIITGENRNTDFLTINPFGQVPVMQTEDGALIAEVTAIAEYLEELRPTPILVGHDAVQRAQARMWARRIDWLVLMPMGLGFQNSVGSKFFEGRIKLYPAIGEPMNEKANDGLAELDGLLAGRTYLCGDRLSYGDFMLFAYMDFYRKVGQSIDSGLVHLTALFDTMAERYSARQTESL